MLKASLMALLLLAASFMHSAHASLIFDEAVAGDLSDDNLAPSYVALGAGSTIITGTALANPFDRDIFRITVPDGQELAAIVLAAYISGDDQSFFAVAAGNTISSLVSPNALLGNALIGAAPGAMQGDDILDNLGALTFPGSAGFSGALGPGDYTFWLQEVTVGIREYALDFQLRSSSVPLPSTVPLFLLGLLGVALRRRHRTA